LVFGKTERDPIEEFKLQFEAIKNFNDDEKETTKRLLDTLILQHHATQLHTRRNNEASK